LCSFQDKSTSIDEKLSIPHALYGMGNKLLKSEHLEYFRDVVASLTLIEKLYHEQICLTRLGCLHQKGKKILIISNHVSQAINNGTELA